MFQVSDLSFEHDNAILDAFWLNGSFEWGLSLQGTRPDRLFGEQWWPRAYCERIPGLRTVGIQDLFQRCSSWKEAYLEETGDTVASLYVFEHLDIRNAEIRFAKFEKNCIPFVWKGVCDICFNPEYNTNLPLQIEAIGELKRIYTKYLDENTARSELSVLGDEIDGQFVVLDQPRSGFVSLFEI